MRRYRDYFFRVCQCALGVVPLFGQQNVHVNAFNNPLPRQARTGEPTRAKVRAHSVQPQVRSQYAHAGPARTIAARESFGTGLQPQNSVARNYSSNGFLFPHATGAIRAGNSPGETAFNSRIVPRGRKMANHPSQPYTMHQSYRSGYTANTYAMRRR